MTVSELIVVLQRLDPTGDKNVYFEDMENSSMGHPITGVRIWSPACPDKILIFTY